MATPLIGVTSWTNLKLSVAGLFKHSWGILGSPGVKGLKTQRTKEYFSNKFSWATNPSVYKKDAFKLLAENLEKAKFAWCLGKRFWYTQLCLCWF